MSGEPQAKVVFRLSRDEDGYPPVDLESLWATPLGDGRFELDNVPFYVRGISCGDIVAAKPYEGGEWLFDELITPSRNSTLRVFTTSADSVQSVRAELIRLGADCEMSNLQRFFSVHVPAGIALAPVLDYLRNLESRGEAEYEEAALRHG